MGGGSGRFGSSRRLWGKSHDKFSGAMETIAISKFKATCASLLDRVKKTGEPLTITKRGKPIAQVVPPAPAGTPKGSTFGCMAGTVEILGDIVELPGSSHPF